MFDEAFKVCFRTHFCVRCLTEKLQISISQSMTLYNVCDCDVTYINILLSFSSTTYRDRKKAANNFLFPVFFVANFFFLCRWLKSCSRGKMNSFLNFLLDSTCLHICNWNYAFSLLQVERLLSFSSISNRVSLTRPKTAVKVVHGVNSRMSTWLQVLLLSWKRMKKNEVERKL